MTVIQEWLATLDGRTRHSHAVLDGEQVAQDKKFSNGCRYPGDPQGPAWEIYNCRCTLVAAIDGIDTSSAKRRARTSMGDNEIISNMTYKQWVERKTLEKSAENSIIETGAKGALTSVNDPDFKRRVAHARRYYASVRNSDKENIINHISENTGMNESTVNKAVSHLFFEKHDLEKGFDYFEEDYDIAESIQRLRNGKGIQSHDVILLKHEALESDYMSMGFSFEEAHEKAEYSYNYTLALRAYLKENKLE